jgi:hypothetical protein
VKARRRWGGTTAMGRRREAPHDGGWASGRASRRWVGGVP